MTAESRKSRLPRDFRLYWLAGGVDRLGTQISGLALPLLLLDTGASAARAGLAVTIAGIGGLLAGPFAAVLADGRSRRPVMLGSALIAALAMGGATATVLTHHISLPLLVLAMLVERLAASCYQAAAGGSIVRLVPADAYPGAVARLQAGDQAALVTGPGLAGVLLQCARWLPFLADAASYLLAAVCVRLIRTDLTPPAGAAEHDAGETFLSRLAAGVRHVREVPFLRFALVWITGANLLLMLLSYEAVFAIHRASGNTPVGLMLAVAGAAGLIGSLAAPALVSRVGGRAVVVAISWLTVPVAVALAPGSPVWVHGALLGAVSLLIPAVVVVVHSRMVLIVPQHLQSRVTSVWATAAAVVMMAAPGAAGTLADTIGTGTTDLSCAGALTLLALYATLSRALRETSRTAVPDAVPGAVPASDADAVVNAGVVPAPDSAPASDADPAPTPSAVPAADVPVEARRS
ncbi:MFS transporter [Streptomyces sp. SL13]|uniref:MFS transporter n=1 Tax=Streptantibioticus silvisoli TaxID=2705255 RepID=A0AA90H6I1_9ACTN|nr:MFS transporter [Streptantibioticus silvisoli]MDI5968932.1 MFS transporter [Streptantibioticus silvisoli]